MRGDPSPRPRLVVFDANVLVQALLSGRGPAFACVESVRAGEVELVATESILAEVGEVLLRIAVKPRYAGLLTEGQIAAFLADLRVQATILSEPPRRFELPRDPDDEVYVNLAAEAGATLLASWDKDLLHLMEETNAGEDFRARFPGVEILDPPAFLARLRAARHP